MQNKVSNSLFKKNISQIVFEWQEANRLSLLAAFMCIELLFHWFGYSFIWFNDKIMMNWVNNEAFGVLWLVSGQMLLVYSWFVLYTYRQSKRGFSIDKRKFRMLQYIMLYVYLGYLGLMYVMIGAVNIFVGVTIVASTIICILLMNRRIVWNTFLAHLLVIFVLVIALPILDLNFPHVYKTGKDHSSHDCYANLFWHSFYLYLSLPKALMGVGLIIHLVKAIETRLKEAQYQANYDKLTKVTNRRYIMQYLFDQLFLANNEKEDDADSKEQCCALSIILLDIDFFKSINDTYGHLSGDMVLIELAKRISDRMTGKGWEVARHGGEEFLVVLPQTPHYKAMEFAGQLHKALCTEQYRIVDGMSIDVTSSFGVATFEHDEVVSIRQDYNRSETHQQSHQALDINSVVDGISASSEDLVIENIINMADGALYDAKRLGRNRIVSANQYVDETSSYSSIDLNVMRTEEILQGIEIEAE